MILDPHRSIRAFVLVVLGVWLLGQTASALDESTHRIVNGRAALASASLDAFLRDSLGFSRGLNTSLRHGSTLRNVREWIEDGGEREDDLLRFLRHFHDPLQPWGTAGLNLPIGRHSSSVRWMQDPNQGGTATGGLWSWRDARRFYYDALTEPDPVRREVLWADLFRALGQIMHLVVDASVPEHTRDDMHVLGALKLANSYERWVAGQHGVGSTQSEAAFVARYLSAPIGFLSDIFETPIEGEGIATVPVARLIDADRYDGTNPYITVDGADPRAPVSVGLAEIANANFFSEDTLRGEYPSPTDTGLISVKLTTPLGRVRRYLTRPPGVGLLPANPLRAECATDAYFQRGLIAALPPYPCMDGVVWNQVAAHMLPRAVGYARGVLDYFFRGSMRVHTLYADEGGAFIRIENLTDEEMEGVFAVYARPMAETPDESREQVGLIADGVVTKLSANATVTLPVTLLPGKHPTASQTLVFRGRLGLELDGVAAQIFDVHHLLITQTAATTVMSESCNAFEARTVKGSQCDWRSASSDVEGELLADATVPVIARVSASWELAVGSRSAQIALDGVPIPGGVWYRRSTEPDPQQFRILAGANQGNRLVLSVQLVSGDTVTLPMVVLSQAFASSTIRYTQISSHVSPGPWWVAAERNASTLAFVHSPFRTRSIGGHPNPTEIHADRFPDSRLQEYLIVSDTVSGPSYRQRWIDAAEVFITPPPGGPIVLEPMLKATFDAMQVSPLPVVLMEVEVERVYEPAEIEFLKTFVTSVLPPHRFTAIGRLPRDIECAEDIGAVGLGAPGQPGVGSLGFLGNLLSAGGFRGGDDLGLLDVGYFFVVRVLHVIRAASAGR